MRTTFLSLAVIILTLSSCGVINRSSQGKASVTRISDTLNLKSGSLVYSLPRTVFTVKAGIERTIMIPGPYADYADDLLGLKDVIKTRSERWSIKSILVNSHEEADPSEYYVINSIGIFENNVLAMKKEGVILDINPSGNYIEAGTASNGEANFNRFRSYDLGSDEYYQIQTDTAFRRIRIDSSFIRIPYIVEKKKKLTPDQLAERAAKRLLDLRDGKAMILSGEANVFPQNEAAINEINSMEKEYTELFTGKYITETVVFTCQFIPSKEDAGKPHTLFMFSDQTGPGTTSGQPVLAEIVPEKKLKDMTILESGDSKGNKETTAKLFYRIPDVAGIRITLNGKSLYSSRKLVYQLGEVMQLPSNYVIGK